MNIRIAPAHVATMKTVNVREPYGSMNGVRWKRRRITIPVLSEQQRDALLGALRDEFGCKQFDTTVVISRVGWVRPKNSPLTAAIEAIPDVRYRDGYLRHKLLWGVLSDLAAEYFVTDSLGWWQLKEVQ